MGRGKSRNPRENPGVRPVTQLELSQKSPKKRIILAVVLLVIGVGFLGYGVFNALSQEEGWTEIEPLSASAESVASDLTFLYDLGASGNSAGAEYKALSRLYSELCAEAFRLFDADLAFDGVYNLYFINHRPGETVTVDPALYHAFEQLARSGSRLLFAAPYYTEYYNLFSADDDVLAAEVDPYKNPEIAAYFESLSVYTSSEEHVRLELLGDCKVKLVVSEEYRAFAAREGIESYLDFGWARNAFALDYIADALIENGFSNGNLSSYDGFVRVMDTRETSYSYQLYSQYEGRIYGAARFDYKGANSIVLLHSYQMSEREVNYYAYKDGALRFPYVDPDDGFCHAAAAEMVSYSRDASCAEVLLSMLPVYLSDTLDRDAVAELAEDGVYSIYFDGFDIRYNDPAAVFQNVYQYGDIAFKPVKE